MHKNPYHDPVEFWLCCLDYFLFCFRIFYLGFGFLFWDWSVANKGLFFNRSSIFCCPHLGFHSCMQHVFCRAFTISAVAQLFVLGNTWIFGSFQFQENHTAMAYLTIFGSLEGVTLFTVYCLFSRQVSDIHA